jgi:hypothetical protein
MLILSPHVSVQSTHRTRHLSPPSSALASFSIISSLVHGWNLPGMVSPVSHWECLTNMVKKTKPYIIPTMGLSKKLVALKYVLFEGNPHVQMHPYYHKRSGFKSSLNGTSRCLWHWVYHIIVLGFLFKVKSKCHHWQSSVCTFKKAWNFRMDMWGTSVSMNFAKPKKPWSRHWPGSLLGLTMLPKATYTIGPLSSSPASWSKNAQSSEASTGVSRAAEEPVQEIFVNGCQGRLHGGHLKPDALILRMIMMIITTIITITWKSRDNDNFNINIHGNNQHDNKHDNG